MISKYCIGQNCSLKMKHNYFLKPLKRLFNFQVVFIPTTEVMGFFTESYSHLFIFSSCLILPAFLNLPLFFQREDSVFVKKLRQDKRGELVFISSRLPSSLQLELAELTSQILEIW